MTPTAPPQTLIMSREWAMPHKDTFTIQPISRFLGRHLSLKDRWVDPFSGRKSPLPVEMQNDLSPETPAKHHMEAVDFLKTILAESLDGVLFDPPYSPRQISECYYGIGRKATTKETQSAVLYMKVRDEIRRIVKPGGMCLSFGWNSCGMGKGWEIIEILLVAHGGAHNDTICMAERRKRGK